MAKKFYSYFWGRIDVFARRGKAGGYFPQCKARWSNSNCPKKVDKRKARSFGYALLDKGAESINLPSFKYYDRMYPSQDVLSKLGNLVALPLQGRALKSGNSAFIDESWNAYPNQWSKLESVRKVTIEEVTAFLQEWNAEHVTEPLSTKYAKDKGQVRPWKRDERFNKSDAVGEEMHIVLDDGVYVDSLNLLPRIQNQIKGMATIDNPEYIKRDRGGWSNFFLFMEDRQPNRIRK